MADIMGELTGRAHTQGRLRPEITPMDLRVLHLALSLIMERSEQVRPQLYLRYAELFSDAVSMNPPQRPLAPGLSKAELAAFLRYEPG